MCKVTNILVLIEPGGWNFKWNTGHYFCKGMCVGMSALLSGKKLKFGRNWDFKSAFQSRWLLFLQRYVCGYVRTFQWKKIRFDQNWDFNLKFQSGWLLFLQRYVCGYVRIFEWKKIKIDQHWDFKLEFQSEESED